MKYQIIIELLKSLNNRPDLKRKVKTFALVGVVGLVITLALTIWAGVAVFNFATSKANEVIQSIPYQNHIETAKNEIKGLPKIHALNCWTTAQSLMALQPWVERPAVANLMNLKTACLDFSTTVCQGVDCNNLRKTTNEIEGDLI